MQRLVDRGAAKRPVPGQQFVQDRPQREDVAAPVQPMAFPAVDKGSVDHAAERDRDGYGPIENPALRRGESFVGLCDALARRH